MINMLDANVTLFPFISSHLSGFRILLVLPDYLRCIISLETMRSYFYHNLLF